MVVVEVVQVDFVQLLAQQVAVGHLNLLYPLLLAQVTQ
jgi:hypothetical protein